MIPLTNVTAPTEPPSFSATPQINGTILFEFGRPIVRPSGTEFQIIRSTNSANAAVGTVVWQGAASPVPLVMPMSAHFYYVRSVANSQTSPYVPNTFGNYAVAWPQADNTLASRVTPDAEFALSTDNGSYWIWSNSVHGSIALTGGEVGGRFQFVTGSAGFTGLRLQARHPTGYPAIAGQPFRLVFRYRRTTAVAANVGLTPTIRLGVVAVSTTGVLPAPAEGGYVPVEVNVSSAVLNTWLTVTAPFSLDVNVSSLTPFVTAVARFDLNYMSSGTIQIDAFNVYPSQ